MRLSNNLMKLAIRVATDTIIDEKMKPEMENAIKTNLGSYFDVKNSEYTLSDHFSSFQSKV